MKILITGGCGFVGSNLIQKILKETEHTVVVLDNLSSSTTKYFDTFDSSRTTLVKGDIRNPEDISKAVEGCEVIVNLAAQTGVVPSMKDPFFDMDVNVKGIVNLLEACRAHNINRFVQASSAAPLGKQKSVPVNESMVPSPMAPYGASKLAGEGYCSAYAYSFGISSVVLRFSNIYGPLSDTKTSVIAKFIKRIKNNEELHIYGDGNQTRDFVHVEDICQAIILALSRDIDAYEVIQLGTGIETSINELFSLFESFYGSIKKVHTDPLPGEILRNFTDISKAKDVLGYEPQYTLANGLPETLEWFKQQP